MVHDFNPGDFLIFQLESGFALVRILDVGKEDGEDVWHVAAYQDLFLDPEAADKALENPEKLTLDKPHLALTNRAFESTQTARMRNVPLTQEELAEYEAWKNSFDREVSDRSIRLLLGLR